MGTIFHPFVADASASDFRGAMRHLTGGVSVITTGRGTEVTGMTVTSVTSLSVDPPTLIVSIRRDASTFPILKRRGVFGVNILNVDQIEIAERFAGKGELKGMDRFAGAKWFRAMTGAPLLVGALSALDCEVEDIIDRHSHGIVVGRALKIINSSREAALAYWHGHYVAVDRDEDIARLAEVSVPSRNRCVI